MESLFEVEKKKFEPLAVRMRPTGLDEFYGQEAVVGKGTFLRKMIEADTIPSLLLYGPSGTGKTTLAQVIAHVTKSRFVTLNATNIGISELRKAMEEAKKAVLSFQERTILFLDEIHRFNKGQQDVLLPFVEEGSVVLIGATTENPFFEINRPLLSRMRLLVLSSLDETAIASILQQALTNVERGLGGRRITADKQILLDMGRFSGGDARMALNLLEQAAAMVNDGEEITADVIEKVAGRRIQTYDKKGNSHYDTISAFIKSMRGSDPQAALHYLARMIDAGEDPSFIARRIIICAAEDVGLADPQALVLATAAAQAVHVVGFPEARIILGEAAVYVALAPKSNSAYLGIDAALNEVRTKDCGPVPPHLRDGGYKGANELGRTNDYLYAHDYPQAYVKQQYMPDKIIDHVYYRPLSHGCEKHLAKEWLERMGEKKK